MIWDHWDAGTGRAVLALYRHADPDRLAEAGKDLGRLACPSLVVWGERDPYLSTKFAQAFADALPNSEMDLIAGAGHWPWIDDATGHRPRRGFPQLSAGGMGKGGSRAAWPQRPLYHNRSRADYNCPMSRALKTVGSWLPKGWGDLGRQIGILVGVDIAYELVRGIADSSAPRLRPRPAGDRLRARHPHLLRARACRRSSCPRTG